MCSAQSDPCSPSLAANAIEGTNKRNNVNFLISKYGNKVLSNSLLASCSITIVSAMRSRNSCRNENEWMRQLSTLGIS